MGTLLVLGGLVALGLYFKQKPAASMPVQEGGIPVATGMVEAPITYDFGPSESIVQAQALTPDPFNLDAMKAATTAALQESFVPLETSPASINDIIGLQLTFQDLQNPALQSAVLNQPISVAQGLIGRFFDPLSFMDSYNDGIDALNAIIYYKYGDTVRYLSRIQSMQLISPQRLAEFGVWRVTFEGGKSLTGTPDDFMRQRQVEESVAMGTGSPLDIAGYL